MRWSKIRAKVRLIQSRGRLLGDKIIAILSFKRIRDAFPVTKLIPKSTKSGFGVILESKGTILRRNYE